MIVKWVEFSFYCDVCNKEAVHPDNEHIKKEAIKDLKMERYDQSMKGWVVKGDSVLCADCK